MTVATRFFVRFYEKNVAIELRTQDTARERKKKLEIATRPERNGQSRDVRNELSVGCRYLCAINRNVSSALLKG